ncbi:NADPH-dependent FMN reductase [Naasia sp. SYSU D00948]|uniref:NADPH-dependent FMN reductase n=1 Tax=Naasia sp. SYSU D00948 TaxID=2817379 RepID=UPI001B314A90|nr:NAD(P)H-dependent oxidoreductase [Naasia sp. SYSU D00948]
MLSVTILAGNPKPASRTLRVAEAVVDRLLAPGSYETRVIDLADHAASIFTWPSEEMAELTAAVAATDLLVVASPTYKASYTGLLKGFLDRYPANGLAGVVAIPVMTGGDSTHSVGLDAHLRPLLVELGASVPTRGLYFTMNRMGELADVVGAWADEASAALARISGLDAALRIPAVEGVR